MEIAVDIGGTFTDVVLHDKGVVQIAKARTTPNNLTDGVLDGIGLLLDSPSDVGYVLHGTTVIINALVENKGMPTALITTRGFRDVYEIARGSRYEPYNFLFERMPPLVQRRHRYELAERMNSEGSPVTTPSPEDITGIVRKIADAGINSVAVCLINSYANGAHESIVRDVIRNVCPELAVTLSHELVQEWREFERTSTTVMNAYVAPITEKYVDDLDGALRKLGFSGQFLMMQSNGGSLSRTSAKSMPMALVESGPASGVVGAAKLSQLAGAKKAVAFDMGGTTAKASLIIDGDVRTVRPYHVGGVAAGRPSLFPVVDLVEVGAGGGSVARVTEGGALVVGPESAGSDPGPVAYARGGGRVTVTDADLVLGRLSAEAFLGGEVRLDVGASRRAVAESIAAPLGIDSIRAAAGIVEIVDNSMALAVKQVSVEHGENPRELTLIAFGGAGPTHAASVARILGVPKVLIPPAPENFSACSMLLADVSRQLTRPVLTEVLKVSTEEINAVYSALQEGVLHLLAEETGHSRRASFSYQAELRYVGQEKTLVVNLPDNSNANQIDALVSGFAEVHEHAYGYSVNTEPIEFVSATVVGYAQLDVPSVEVLSGASAVKTGVMDVSGTRDVYFAQSGGFVSARVLARSDVPMSADACEGPIVIQEYGATTIVPPHWRVFRDSHENLVLEES